MSEATWQREAQQAYDERLHEIRLHRLRGAPEVPWMRNSITERDLRSIYPFAQPQEG